MDATLLDAEEGGEVVLAEAKNSESLNLALGATLGVIVIFILMSRVIGAPFEEEAIVELIEENTPIWERYTQNFESNGSHSYVLENGTKTGPDGQQLWTGTHYFVDFDLPIEEGGSAPNGMVSLAIWVPILEEGETVPVIAEFGPYFQEPSVQTPTIEVPGTWLGQMIIDQILPHGYAFAQVSVTGTGRSNHCMDLMGTAEQLGNDAAVSWLGSQDWSNGNVAMIGKSYDGSTPWQAAMFGSEHDYLKTIVPISGLIGVKELMWKNGSSEARAPIMHNGVYGSYGIDGDEEDYQNLCPDYIIGPGTGVGAWAWGGEAAGSYWAERYFLDRVLENYQGSVYLIQGMHDWNVDPHMAVPTINRLIDAGIEARGLFGQWDHDYPDRPVQLDDRSELGGRGGEAFPEMIRFDWMQDMLEWFDYYLKDIGEQPGQWIEIQSNQGSWRIEERYPPADVVVQSFELGTDMANIGGTTTVLPDASSGPVWESTPLENDLYFSGMPRVHVDVTTATLGGQLYALLEDCNDQGQCIHLGHAIMDLRYHAGGDEVQTWTPVVETINAKMEFFAMDAEVEAGHVLRLSLRSTGEDYLPASTSSVVFVQEGATSTLQLDTFEPSERRYFTPPVCTHERCLQVE